MRRLLSLSFILGAAWADNARLTGVVLDPSDHPVPNARVECAGKTTNTGADGTFEISGILRCAARITAEGFAPTTTLLESGVEARAALAVAGVNESVLVSARRAEVSVEEAGVAASIVTEREIEMRQYPAVPDLLRELPGMHVVRTGRQGGVAAVFTRGSQRTGTLVMIDGVPVNDPGGDLNLAYLQTGAIERIEVIRGAESPSFGAEASAAVVQLFTVRGDPERKWPRGVLSYERGSFQTDRWNAHLAGGAGAKFDYSTGVEQYHSVGEFQNDFFRNTTGTASAGYRFSDATRMRAVLRGFDAAAGIPGRTAYGIFDNDANQVTRDYTASIRVDDMRGGRFLQRLLASHHRQRWFFDDRISDGPYRSAALVREEPSGLPLPRRYLERLVDPNAPGPVPPGMRLELRTTSLFAFPGEGETSRTGADYQGTLTHQGGAVLFGYEYERQAGEITGSDVDRDNHGMFLHGQHTIGRVYLSAGARLERNSVFGVRTTPRVAASVRVAGEHGALSSTFFRISAGRGITEPSLLQSFARETFYVGNPNLRPEKTTSYEAGVVQEWFGRRVRTEVAAFHNSFDDLIVFNTALAIGTWENIDTSRARGLEFSTQARFLRFFTASANYTRLWTRITRSMSPPTSPNSQGHPLARRPEHSGALTLTVAPSRWYLHLGAWLVGERPDSDFFGINRSRSYQHLYASGGWHLHRHVEPFFRVDNLLNSRYQEVLGYSSLSRMIRGGLRLSW